MAFIFTMHSHRRDQPSAGALPAISEDGNDIEIHPSALDAGRNYPNMSGRAMSAMSNTSRPWARIQNGDSPRSFFTMSDGSGSDDTDHEQEKRLAELRENPQIAKRGGWRRLALMALIAILCIVGLVVGLVVGLNKRNTSNSSTASSTNATSTLTGFPAGSYAIQTYLNTVTTNCTSNPATWRCYPYTTYAQSSTSSVATFSWVITALPGINANPPTYTISSTNNPFSLVFSSTPLTLINAGAANEYFSFVLTGQNKPVVPTIALTSSNVATTCFFNQTQLEARLYTKMSQTYPSSSSPSSSAGSNGQGGIWNNWPYAAMILQTASGGQDVPQCFDTQGNAIGTFTPETGGECSCEYQNYGT